MLVSVLLVASSVQSIAQKSFKFDRVNFIPKETKEIVFPAQLTALGPDDTYKFVGTQNTIGVYPAQMNLGKGNGVNVKEGAAKCFILKNQNLNVCLIIRMRGIRATQALVFACEQR